MLCTTAVNTSNTITYAVNAFLVFGCRQQGGVESGSTRRRKTGPDRADRPDQTQPDCVGPARAVMNQE